MRLSDWRGRISPMVRSTKARKPPDRCEPPMDGCDRWRVVEPAAAEGSDREPAEDEGLDGARLRPAAAATGSWMRGGGGGGLAADSGDDDGDGDGDGDELDGGVVAAIYGVTKIERKKWGRRRIIMGRGGGRRGREGGVVVFGVVFRPLRLDWAGFGSNKRGTPAEGERNVERARMARGDNELHGTHQAVRGAAWCGNRGLLGGTGTGTSAPLMGQAADRAAEPSLEPLAWCPLPLAGAGLGGLATLVRFGWMRARQEKLRPFFSCLFFSVSFFHSLFLRKMELP